MSIVPHLSDAGKHVVDYSIGAAGVAYFFQLLPEITGIAALLLIVLRIIIGVQEWKLNKRRLGGDE